MAEQTVTTPSQGADAKTIAGNISKSIQSRADGGKSQETAKASTNTSPPTATDPNAGKERYVVDGQEFYLTPEQARAYAQKGIAFEPKVTQLGQLKNEMGLFMKTLTTDPMKILTDKRIGHTPEAVLEKILDSGNISDTVKEKIGKWYYENVIQPIKSPEEYAQAQKDKKISEYERRDLEAKDNATRQENAQRVELAFNQIRANIAEAMKESGLPNNDTPIGAEMARMVADVMNVSRIQRQSVTPKQAIEFVKARIKNVQKAYYDTLDGDALVQEIGEENAEKVKKHFLKLAKETEKKIPDNQKRMPGRSGDRKTINLDDFHDQLAELKKKG